VPTPLGLAARAIDRSRIRCSLRAYRSRLPSIGGTHPNPQTLLTWAFGGEFSWEDFSFFSLPCSRWASQDTPRTTRGHSVESTALRRPFLPPRQRKGSGASAAPGLPGVYAPGDIAPGTSAPPSSHAIGSSGVTPPTVGAPGLAGVYAPGQAAPASRTAVVPPTEAVVGPGPSVSLWPGSGFGRVYGPFPVGRGGPLSVGQALPLNIVPTPLPDQPRNGVAVVNGHRLILERGTNRIIQDLD
jgi:hypothetical protein